MEVGCTRMRGIVLFERLIIGCQLRSPAALQILHYRLLRRLVALGMHKRLGCRLHLPQSVRFGYFDLQWLILMEPVFASCCSGIWVPCFGRRLCGGLARFFGPANLDDLWLHLVGEKVDWSVVLGLLRGLNTVLQELHLKIRLRHDFRTPHFGAVLRFLAIQIHFNFQLQTPGPSLIHIILIVEKNLRVILGRSLKGLVLLDSRRCALLFGVRLGFGCCAQWLAWLLFVYLAWVGFER